MRKIFLYIAVAGLIPFAACDKRLELKNPQSIDATDGFSTEAKVKKGLVGNYESLGAGRMFGGDPPWFQHQYFLARQPRLIQQCQRDMGGFPRPRRRFQHRLMPTVQGLFEVADAGIDR